jgi:fructose-specific component phosphotransferase system IIB-like protein
MKMLRFSLAAALIALCASAYAGDFPTPGSGAHRGSERLNELRVDGEIWSEGEDSEIFAEGGITFDDDEELEIFYDDDDDILHFRQRENGEGSWEFTVSELDVLNPDAGVELAVSDERAKISITNVDGNNTEFRNDNDEGELTITTGNYMLAIRDMTGGDNGVAQMKIGTDADSGGLGANQGVVIGNEEVWPGHTNLSLNSDGLGVVAGQFRIYENDDNGENYFALIGPAALAGDVTCTIDASGKIPSSCISGTSGLANVVEDLSPQLGGNLDMFGADITTTDVASVISLNPNSDASYVGLSLDNDSTGTTADVRINLTSGTTAAAYMRCDSSNAGCEWRSTTGYLEFISATNMFLAANGGTTSWRVDSTGYFAPTADGTQNIGTTTVGINTLHFDDGGVISFENSDVAITHSTNDLAFTGVTGDYSFDDTVGVTGSVTASVDVTATAGDVTSGDDLIAGSDLLLPSSGAVRWNTNEVNITHTGSDTISTQGGSFGVHQDSDTISGGAIGYSRNFVVVDTEAAAATDTLDTMTAAPIGGVMKWIQAANDARTVVIAGDSSGNIVAPGGTYCVLDDAEDSAMFIYNSTLAEWVLTSCSQAQSESISVAASDETTPITATAGKVKWRMPYAFNIDGIRCSLSTAQNTTGGGTIFTVDVNEGDADLDGGNPVSILSTKITLDDDETTSLTATTAPVLSDVVIAANAEMSIDVDAIGASADAAGLKCSLIGHQ